MYRRRPSNVYMYTYESVRLCVCANGERRLTCTRIVLLSLLLRTIYSSCELDECVRIYTRTVVIRGEPTRKRIAKYKTAGGKPRRVQLQL